MGSQSLDISELNGRTLRRYVNPQGQFRLQGVFFWSGVNQLNSIFRCWFLVFLFLSRSLGIGASPVGDCR